MSDLEIVYSLYHVPFTVLYPILVGCGSVFHFLNAVCLQVPICVFFSIPDFRVKSAAVPLSVNREAKFISMLLAGMEVSGLDHDDDLNSHDNTGGCRKHNQTQSRVWTIRMIVLIFYSSGP